MILDDFGHFLDQNQFDVLHLLIVFVPKIVDFLHLFGAKTAGHGCRQDAASTSQGTNCTQQRPARLASVAQVRMLTT